MARLIAQTGELKSELAIWSDLKCPHILTNIPKASLSGQIAYTDWPATIKTVRERENLNIPLSTV